MTYGEPYPDPYSAPHGGQTPGYGARPGGLLRRFFARVIDGIVVGVVGFFLAFTTDTLSNILVTGLFTGVLMFGYFVLFEVTQGWTPGKKVLGLHVRGGRGLPKPDLKESAIRNAFTLLPVVPYVGGLLGFVAIVVIAVTISGSATKQGKHDELAEGTQVLEN